MKFRTLRFAALAAAVVLFAPTAQAASCGTTAAGFKPWLAAFKREALKKGITQKTLDRALGSVSYNTDVIAKDRSQKHFKLSFAEFYKLRVSAGGIAKGQAMMKSHAGLLARVEKAFGVQAPVLVAIWSLESFYGQFTGDIPVFSSLATLAYDCRRTELFTDNLYAALQVVQRGDMSPAKMKGAWAGEIGQTQFMARSYHKFAVDFDGNGKRDLIRSKPDALASTARLLQANGWQRGGCWQPGCANFSVLQHWNQSEVYQQTIARMASQLAGGA